ncbi:MAG: sugar phosphate isomerase/epimerase, partial [Bacteroidota bacterium]
MSTRREALQQMAWLTAGSFMVQNAFAFNDVKNKKVGVQLYTVRDLIAKDAKGTIKQVAGIGYSEVENFGYNGKFFGMT